jgi:alpha-tubulin suppressor-like RCC1 family protein
MFMDLDQSLVRQHNEELITDSDVPVAVQTLEGVKSVKAGCDHGLALKNDGTVWAWSYNKFGQLRNGTNGDGTESDVPVRVKNLTSVKNIDGGFYFTLAAPPSSPLAGAPLAS